MNTLTPSRRNVMRALAAITTGLPTLAYAAPSLVCAPLEPTMEWQAAVKAMDAARAAYDAYYNDIYEPVFNARRQQRSDEEAELQRRIDAIPHYTTTSSYETADGAMVHLTTADSLCVRLAMSMVGDAGVDDYAQCCHELFIKGIGKRIMREQEIRKGFTFSELADTPADIEAEHDRLEKASYAAWCAVADFEAATPGDLIAKVTVLKAQDANLDHDEMLADLRRVFGEA